ASFTRLRPSRIPARRKSVRRCCFTVRGLMFSWAAISLLLHPWTSSFNTCSSRCVIFIDVRSNMVLPRCFAYSFLSGKHVLEQQLLRQSFASSHEGTNTRA